MVESFKFLGGQITNNLPGSPHADTIVKKAHQCLYFLRRVRRVGISATTLTNLYRCTIERILSDCITAWYGSCSAQDRKKLQRVVNEAQSVMQTSLPSIDSVYTPRCLGKAASILRTPRTPDILSSTFFRREKDTKVWGHVPTDSRTVSFLLPSDFWIDLPLIKLIFLYTLAMIVTLHSALSPFLPYERYALFV